MKTALIRNMRYLGIVPMTALCERPSQCGGEHIGWHASASLACLSAAICAGTRLHLDTRILGVGGRRIFLGARGVDAPSRTRAVMDAWILGQ